MVLNDDVACISRRCLTARAARLICTQLERKLEGLCSCMFDPGRVVTLAYKVEQCFTARPLPFLFKSVTFVLHGNLWNDGYPSLGRLHDTFKVTSAVVDVVITK